MSKWISVKDRLPGFYNEEFSNEVIIHTDELCLYVASINFNTKKWIITDGRENLDINLDNVDYWMPLPEPPEIEK